MANEEKGERPWACFTPPCSQWLKSSRLKTNCSCRDIQQDLCKLASVISLTDQDFKSKVFGAFLWLLDTVFVSRDRSKKTLSFLLVQYFLFSTFILLLYRQQYVVYLGMFNPPPPQKKILSWGQGGLENSGGFWWCQNFQNCDISVKCLYNLPFHSFQSMRLKNCLCKTAKLLQTLDKRSWIAFCLLSSSLRLKLTKAQLWNMWRNKHAFE